ncbi:MAG: hypothetical protein PUJ92_00830 [Bacilli bacterium]|nr:hypothetical protein [Bacilli bacterium]MDY5832918.1 hypothetical protein [Candidatus Onthovivens sp.]
MEDVKSFEINKIYHITLDASEFENSEYQLDYDNLDKKDLLCIHFIDHEQNVVSNLIIPIINLTHSNFYYKNNNGKQYYFIYNESEKKFLKEWEK